MIGRRAGSEPGYDYSLALRNARITWSSKTLDAWLQNPNALVPGNKMVVQLANDDQDRADLVVYLVAKTPKANP